MSPPADAYVVRPFGGPVDADVELPGSKSISNRALVAAALADGDSTLEGVLASDDTEAMVACLRGLGFGVDVGPGGTTVVVHGRGGEVPAELAALDVRLAGTVARFLPPVAALGHGEYRFDGTPRMRERPMGPVVEALRALGADVDEHGAPGALPFTVRAGGLRGGRVALPGDTSSQFVSGLLLAGPCMRDGLRVELTTSLVSEPYVEMTRRVMADFGVAADGLTVAPGRYRARRYRVEPDASAASYFLALAAVCGGRVRVRGLGRGSLQGDVAFADLLGAMGATVVWPPAGAAEAGGGVEVRVDGSLRGIDVDMADVSDTVPTLAVVAAFATTPTRITGVGFIRHKESDRVGNVVTELRRLGVDAVEEPDGLAIRPGGAHGGRVATYGDHRMAMAFAVAGAVVPGVEVADPGCVAKTFPGFWDAFEAVRPR